MGCHGFHRISLDSMGSSTQAPTKVATPHLRWSGRHVKWGVATLAVSWALDSVEFRRIHSPLPTRVATPHLTCLPEHLEWGVATLAGSQALDPVEPREPSEESYGFPRNP